MTDQTNSNIAKQVERLRDFAQRSKLLVVDEVRLENRSAQDAETRTALEALHTRKRDQNDFDVVVTSDLSRLSRDGFCHVMNLVTRFAKVGVGVLTLDLGLIDEALYSTFRGWKTKKTKDWVRRHAKKTKAGRADHLPGDDGRGEQEVSDGPQHMADGTRNARANSKEGD